MTCARALTSVSMVLAAVLLAAAAVPKEYFVPGSSVRGTTFDQQSVWRTWKIYCDTCHFGPKARAGLNLEALDLANLGENGATWEKVLRKLRSREMPPAGVPRPDAATYTALVEAIERERDRLAEVKPNPGRATLHRLNRAEYANAIRDLLALDVDVAELLPADDIGYGFDNIADVLQVSPLLLERYLAAATKISALAVGDTGSWRSPIGSTTFREEPFSSNAWAKRCRSARAAGHRSATVSRSMASMSSGRPAARQVRSVPGARAGTQAGPEARW